MYRENCLSVGVVPYFGMLVEFCDLSVRTPLDPGLPLTSLMDRLPGCLLFVVLSTFCGSQCGSLIFCCCYTYVSAVLVLCRPRVSIVLWCWWCWFCVYEAFCCQVLLFVCFVHVSNSWVQAQWRGALIFFFLKKIYDAFSKENGRCVYSWMSVRCVYGMNGRCV